MELIVESSEGDVLHAACVGDISLYDFRRGEKPLEAALGPACFARKVVLSLQQSCYIDSAGVGWLILCHKRFCEGGGCLVIHSIPPMVSHVFQLLRVSSLLNLADNETHAQERAQAALPARSAGEG